MLHQTHDMIRPILQGRDHGFRRRGREISRIEALVGQPMLSGMTFVLIGPGQSTLGFIHGRGRRRLDAASVAPQPSE